MNSFLLNRALGSVSAAALARSQNTHLVHSLQPASHVSLSISPLDLGNDQDALQNGVAHPAGVNSITIDKFEGRWLLSGGADSSIGIWDLDTPTSQSDETCIIPPLGYASKTSKTANFGITHVSFYAFDSLAFLSSSYDHSLKLYSSETLEASAVFDLEAVVYSHALSPIASHLLVACATQHPAVRLVDLRSGASTHSLAGHSGAVLSTAWHPKREHVLASAGSDGLVRLWDIRRSASSLGVLDMEDSRGTGTGTNGNTLRRERGKAHSGAVNGVTWDDAGDYLVSCGQDDKMRVWNASTGANTLTNFGPAVKSSTTSTLLPLVSPSHLTGPTNEILVYPNPRELLVYEMHTGNLLSRLKTPSHASTRIQVAAGSGMRNVVNKTTSLAWRAHNVELYSGHSDGTIRCWKPRTWEDALDEDEDDEEEGNEEAVERKRKIDELDDMINGLTKRQVTYT
jgi:DNA excision repair protein ERCC-8